jgi:gas vesicle protein
MNSEHLTLEKHLKRTTITTHVVSSIIALITALGVVYGFYYKTNNTLDNHSNQIKEIKVDVTDVKNKVNESQIFQGVSSVEIKTLQEKVNAIDKKVDKMDEKLDKILMK